MIKIDMQFVRDLIDNPQNQHVVKAIVNLAQGLGDRRSPRAWRTQATLDRLEEYGVDYAQGFAIGRPAPIDTLFTTNASRQSQPENLPPATQTAEVNQSNDRRQTEISIAHYRFEN